LYALDPHGLDPAREVLSELWPEPLERLKYVVEQDRAAKTTEPKSSGRRP